MRRRFCNARPNCPCDCYGCEAGRHCRPRRRCYLRQRTNRMFWAWMPDPWLRTHIVNTEMRWSGKGMSSAELSEFVANQRVFRWRF